MAMTSLTNCKTSHSRLCLSGAAVSLQKKIIKNYLKKYIFLMDRDYKSGYNLKWFWQCIFKVEKEVKIWSSVSVFILFARPLC